MLIVTRARGARRDGSGWQTCGMPYERDVEAFDRRAATYESGSLGRVHLEISDRVADLALRQAPAPRRVLDVGSGTGYLLNLLASRLPDAAEFTGVDAAPAMVAAARARTTDERVRFTQGSAEQLPVDDGGYDLVVSATSFDHWTDQGAGLAECRRALAAGGHLVLADLFSPLLWPTLLAGRRGKARTRARATRLITAAGFSPPRWHHVYAAIVQAATAGG
jgi:ubiquinone/menaquinone biosynthesis C-methylase UbiE